MIYRLAKQAGRLDKQMNQNAGIRVNTYTLDHFPNKENQRIGNCHIAIDTLIVIIKAQRQIFSWGLQTLFISVQSTK